LGDSNANFYIQKGLEGGKKSEGREDTEPGRLAKYILDQIPEKFNVYENYDLNERHQAEAIITQCGRWIRFCPEIGWMVYHAEDGCWKEPYAESVVQRIICHFGDLRYEGASDMRPDEARFAKHSLSSAGITAVKTILRNDTRIIIRQEEFDENPDLLNCKGDLYDLRAGTMRPAEPDDLISKTVFCKAAAREAAPEAAPGAAQKAGKEPAMPAVPKKFEEFMKKITSREGVERPDLSLFISFFFGYCLTGDTGASFFVNFHGGGKNGKSVLLKLMMALFGDYAAPVPEDVVIENRFASQFDLANLPGIRLGVLSDAPEGRLNMKLLKPITTGDTISAKRKFMKDFAFKSQCKIAVGSNPRLTLKETGMAIKRRIRMIPFDYTVPDEDEIVNLDKILMEEAPEILALLIFFAQEYYRRGMGPRAFPPCEAVDETSRECLESEDLVGRFIKERVEEKPGSDVKAADLYKDFEKWEEAEGIRKKMSRNKFGERAKTFIKNGRKNDAIYYFDIAIKPGDDGGG
jgi:putative DNA primase/helicase